MQKERFRLSWKSLRQFALLSLPSLDLIRKIGFQEPQRRLQRRAFRHLFGMRFGLSIDWRIEHGRSFHSDFERCCSWPDCSCRCVCGTGTGQIHEEKKIKIFSQKCVALCGLKLSYQIEGQYKHCRKSLRRLVNNKITADKGERAFNAEKIVCKSTESFIERMSNNEAMD